MFKPKIGERNEENPWSLDIMMNWGKKKQEEEEEGGRRERGGGEREEGKEGGGVGGGANLLELRVLLLQLFYNIYS